ncbi:FAD-binding protein [Maritimibacter sp. DP07]|uniref:FAD-binding protein n=1 Tax=Maritimibacter harenae TaxID=2606218 RepID=A0A845M1M4_9RHOB|nr:GMC family oxidoreductase [Maritimibacter harenae]MZR14260.1 FAD-binding protein [Maritimibacter harenae]
MEDVDVLIVGSGPGGGAAAWRLATKGLRVRVLEAGPAFEPRKDYAQDREDWETPFPVLPGSRAPYDVADLQNLGDEAKNIRSWNSLSGPYVPGERRASFGYHHVRGVGGSSLHFTGEAHRLTPAAMKMRSDFGVAADWPMDYDALAPYWQLAEQTVGIAGPADDLRAPRRKPYPMPAHPFSFASARLAEAARDIGMSIQPNSLAALSTPYDDRPECNFCGGCLRGCQRLDKGTIDVTYLRHAVNTGRCEVLPGVEALQIEAEGNRATGVLCKTQDGLQVFQAKVIFLACGAVQTPRLLLNSAASHSPDGLANESGEVGRNFMETLLFTSSALHPEDLGSHRGLPVDWVSWDYSSPDSIPGLVGGARFGPSMAESDLVGPVAYATRVVDGWGADHKRRMRQTFGRALSVTGIGACLPNVGSFITLSERKDASGLPVPRIHSELKADAFARIRFMAQVCRDILAAANCDKPFEEFSSADAFSSTHVFGTCRMGRNADESVVDEFCRSHRWRNLFITDGSVFPSSGGGESPGLTIQALALRASDHLLSEKTP